MTIEDFLSANTTKHEFIRKHTHTATRNFDKRVKTFIKTIVMNTFSPLKCQEYSYRVEFQMRGAAHIHGILWVDIDQIIKEDKAGGSKKLEILGEALQTMYDDKMPSDEEKDALEYYIDKFVTCTLKNPETRDIAMDVQIHHHTKTCQSRGPECRFYFPQFPSLRTMISVPTRLVCPEDENKKKELHEKIKLVLRKVQVVLENQELMDEANQIYRHEIDELILYRDYSLRSKKILEDNIFVSQIQEGTKKVYVDYAKHDPNGEGDSSLEETEKFLIENLKLFQSQYGEMAREQESELYSWEKKRLLFVLKKAELEKLFKIDTGESDADDILLGNYHHFLSFSMKGFSMVLKRDVDEVFVNKFNPEWLNVWGANLDFSPVFDFYGIITYVADYYMKVGYFYY